MPSRLRPPDSLPWALASRGALKFDAALIYGGTPMRTTFLSLIAAAGLTTAVQAQDAPMAPRPPAAPAAAMPMAPDAAPAPVEPGAATPAASAPVAPEAAPAAAPEPPLPTLPTTGDGAVIISVLEKICVPAVRGQGLDEAAKANGFKFNRRDSTWTMRLGDDKNYTITLLPQGSNRDVCRAEVHYAIGQEEPIVSAINIWSFLHQPELILQANYVAVDPDGIKRVRKSWEHVGSNTSTAVNFSTERKPDDTPLNSRYDTGELYYQERTF
jgi:hypothetical protein